MSNHTILSYAESSLPTYKLPASLVLARKYGLALEVANDGNLPVEIYQQSGIKIAAVQAYAMHEFHSLHPDPSRREAAIAHVRETLEIAAKLEAPRIVTVCGFGHNLVERPLERAWEFFSRFSILAKELGVRLMIEPLSPRRCAGFNHPQAVVELIKMLNEPKAFSLMLDTGHLADADIDLDLFFSSWNYPVEELQLKGSLSQPPTPEMPVKSWLESLKSTPPVVCVEHR